MHVKAQYEAIQRLKRNIDALGSHTDGLREKAEKAYSEGNTEQYDAYCQCVEYCEDRLLTVMGRLARLMRRVSSEHGGCYRGGSAGNPEYEPMD